MATLISKDTSGCFVHPLGLPEAVGRRTRTSKVWLREPPPGCTEAGDIAVNLGDPIHYRKDPFSETEQYKEIDLDVVLTPSQDWDAACETNGYQVRFWQSRVYGGRTIRYVAQFRRAGKWLAMAPIALCWENDAGDRQLISKPLAVGAPEIDNEKNHVLWRDVFGLGLHFQYNLRASEFFKTLVIDSKDSLPLPTISGPGLRLTIVMALSWHGQSKAGNQFAESVRPTEPTDDLSVADDFPEEGLRNPEVFSFRDEFDRDTFWLRKPLAWDSAPERHYIDLDWRLRRRGAFVFALLSVPAKALNHPDVVYPVFIDDSIGEEQVGQSADDAGEQSNGSVSITNAQINIADLDVQWGGLRWQTVPLPAGATAGVTTVSTYCRPGQGDDPADSVMHFEEGDAAAFTTDNSNISGRTRTAAGITFPDDNVGQDAWYVSPDLAVPLQEVIDTAWDLNYDLAAIWHAGGGFDSYNFWTWDHDSALAAKLNIAYTVDAAGGGAIVGSSIVGSSMVGSNMIVPVPRWSR